MLPFSTICSLWELHTILFLHQLQKSIISNQSFKLKVENSETPLKNPLNFPFSDLLAGGQIGLSGAGYTAAAGPGPGASTAVSLQAAAAAQAAGPGKARSSMNLGLISGR